ncbi:MAG: hypothetical protein P8O10_07680 [Pseudorhodobacter sp.]|nr:hypothetical protein [Pseudorhodobacter sp.]
MALKKLTLASCLFLVACAETSIQPLSQSSFKVSTETECGTKTTREIAFKNAAIEVIKRGAEKFIIVGDNSGSKVTGGQFTTYGGFIAYENNMQDIVVQIVRKGEPRYSDALSAREALGPDWEKIVAKGMPQTCV